MNYLGQKVIGNFKGTKPKPKGNARAYRQDPKHVAFIRTLPCCITGTPDQSIAHHLLSQGERGAGMKAPDWETVPMTQAIHELLHHECTARTEEQWFWQYNIRPAVLARTLWTLSGDYEAAEHVVRTHRLAS